jgi:hypothetical protein
MTANRESEDVAMTQDPERELSAEEVDDEAAAELPDREAMSLVNLNLAAPINAAVAANVLSDGAVAYADAEQIADIEQSAVEGATLDNTP